jgi:hypothetical protein
MLTVPAHDVVIYRCIETLEATAVRESAISYRIDDNQKCKTTFARIRFQQIRFFPSGREVGK